MQNVQKEVEQWLQQKKVNINKIKYDINKMYFVIFYITIFKMK